MTEGEFIDKLTPKQAIFLREFFKTGNRRQSALKAYNLKNPNSAGALANETLRNLNITIRDFAEANGIGYKELFDKNREMFGATKTRTLLSGAEKEVPNYVVQDKALSRFERWLGIDGNMAQTGVQVNVFNQIKSDKDEYGI